MQYAMACCFLAVSFLGVLACAASPPCSVFACLSGLAGLLSGAGGVTCASRFSMENTCVVSFDFFLLLRVGRVCSNSTVR
jgi:hypothetical protein